MSTRSPWAFLLAHQISLLRPKSLCTLQVSSSFGFSQVKGSLNKTVSCEKVITRAFQQWLKLSFHRYCPLLLLCDLDLVRSGCWKTLSLQKETDCMGTQAPCLQKYQYLTLSNINVASLGIKSSDWVNLLLYYIFLIQPYISSLFWQYCSTEF